MVNVPHLGKFKYLLSSSGSKRKSLKEPIFIWQDWFLEEYNVSARSVPPGKITPEERDVNYATVGVLASLNKDTVVTTIKLLFQELGRQCKETKGKAVKVRVELHGVGRFCCDRGLAKFSFKNEWGTTRPGTGQTCRSLASRGSIMGGEERAIATASSMQSGMRSALNSSAGGGRRSVGSVQRQAAGSTELMTIEEMLAQDDAVALLGDGDMRVQHTQNGDTRTQPKLKIGDARAKGGDRWDSPLTYAPNLEERRGASGSEHLSAFVKAVMEDDGGLDVEQLLDRTAAGSEQGDPEDEPVLPIYFAPSHGRAEPLRAQALKAKSTRSSKKAFVNYVEDRNKERERIYRENKSVEIAQRRAQVEHLKKGMERQRALVSMKAKHVEQMKEREDYFEKDRAWVIAGDVGLPATNRFTGEPIRDELLHPHFDRHRERLAEQIVGNAQAKAESRMEDIMTDEVQNNAVFRDLAADAADVWTKKQQQMIRLKADWAAQRAAMDEDKQLQAWSDGILTDTQTLMPQKGLAAEIAAEDAAAVYMQGLKDMEEEEEEEEAAQAAAV